MKNLLILCFCVMGAGAMAQDSTRILPQPRPAVTPMYTIVRNDSVLVGAERASAAEMLAIKPVTNNYPGRKLLVDGMGVAIYGGMLAWLNGAWYANYPRSSFHTFNDNNEWQQMDKAGHAWAVYSMSTIGYGLWRWSGYSEKKATLLATGSGLAFMLGVEYLDGRSAEWGWSWGDAGADLFGAALFASQQLAWHEQKIRIKFSSTPHAYPPDLRDRARSLFGASLPNKLLKDYNAQTYWISFPLPESWHLPRWLRLSVGYGAEGMFGATENVNIDKATGQVTFDRRDVRRYRQWYLAPDIDLTQIRTKSKFLRSLFYTINIIKLPTPTLELSGGSLKGHLLHF